MSLSREGGLSLCCIGAVNHIEGNLLNPVSKKLITQLNWIICLKSAGLHAFFSWFWLLLCCLNALHHFEQLLFDLLAQTDYIKLRRFYPMVKCLQTTRHKTDQNNQKAHANQLILGKFCSSARTNNDYDSWQDLHEWRILVDEPQSSKKVSL